MIVILLAIIAVLLLSILLVLVCGDDADAWFAIFGFVAKTVKYAAITLLFGGGLVFSIYLIQSSHY